MSRDVITVGFWPDGQPLPLACEDDDAFCIRLPRAILKVLSESMHAIRAQLVYVYSPLAVVQ